MILIKNGKVLDGTGNPWFYADIAIDGEKIKMIGGKLDVKADRVIDADGLIVTPGFVDSHNHAEGYILMPEHRDMESFVNQGITTDMMGLCGFSVFPDNESFVESTIERHRHVADPMWYVDGVKEAGYTWNSYHEYEQVLMETGGVAVNIVPSLGLETILYRVGYRELQKDRKLTPEEMKTTKELIQRGMEEGAIGLSFARDYPYGRYLNTEELIELAKVIADYDGVLHPHMKLITSVEGVKEVIEIARKAEVKLHIAHTTAYLSTLPMTSRGSVNILPEILGILDTAREEGIDVDYNTLQFRGSGGCVFREGYYLKMFFSACTFAPEMPQGVDSLPLFIEKLKQADFRKQAKETILKYMERISPYWGIYVNNHLGASILWGTGDAKLEGRTIGELAKEVGANPTDLFFDIIFGVGTGVIPEGVKPYIEWLAYPELPRLEASSHWLSCPAMDFPPLHLSPEEAIQWFTYDIFPKFFREQRQRGVRIEEVIRKMTSFPAGRSKIYDRGILREGMYADIVIFDPELFSRPAASFYNPTAKPQGMYYVIVNGRVVMDDGKSTGARPGQILFRKLHQSA